MAQADYVISPNPTGLAMRIEVNQIFQAVLTNNSGSVAPTTTQAGMFWGDISNASTYYLKIRNHTNDGWVSLYAYDVATKTISPVNTPAGNISSTTVQDAINELDTKKQPTLVSGTNIKTVNSTSLLGSGNVAVQEPLISGTNIKTINSASLLGSGDVALQPTLVSGTNIKTINSNSILGSGNISITETTWVANDSRAMTALNSGGSAPIYACRAWVNFNGTGTVAIRSSGNVSSITDNGTGDYTVNFTTAMVDANYSFIGTVRSETDGANYTLIASPRLSHSKSVNSFRIMSMVYGMGTVDTPEFNIAVFR